MENKEIKKVQKELLEIRKEKLQCAKKVQELEIKEKELSFNKIRITNEKVMNDIVNYAEKLVKHLFVNENNHFVKFYFQKFNFTIQIKKVVFFPTNAIPFSQEFNLNNPYLENNFQSWKAFRVSGLKSVKRVSFKFNKKCNEKSKKT